MKFGKRILAIDLFKKAKAVEREAWKELWMKLPEGEKEEKDRGTSMRTFLFPK